MPLRFARRFTQPIPLITMALHGIIKSWGAGFLFALSFLSFSLYLFIIFIFIYYCFGLFSVFLCMHNIWTMALACFAIACFRALPRTFKSAHRLKQNKRRFAARNNAAPPLPRTRTARATGAP